MHFMPDDDVSTGGPTGGAGVIWLVSAASSGDAEDGTSGLVVRWDWENDGTWDTPLTAVKSDTHRYVDTENPTISAAYAPP